MGEVSNLTMRVLNSFYFRHVSGNNSPAKELANITPVEVVGHALDVNPVSVGDVNVEVEGTCNSSSSGSESNQVLEQQTSYMRKVGNAWIRLPAPSGTGVDKVVSNAAAPEADHYQNISDSEFPDEPDIDQLFQRFV